MTRPPPRISVCVPLYNEEAVIDELLGRVLGALDATPGGPHEIVLVDDGSSDATVARVERWIARRGEITLIQLSRNFGQQQALSAALARARGDAVMLIDGDLQDPPELLPQLLDHYQRGYDVVYVRRERRRESWLLRLSYWIFYRLMRSLSDVNIPADAGDFSLLSRRVVDVINASPETHRYVRGLRAWAGFSQIGLSIPRPERFAGRPKNSLVKLLRLATDGIFSFTIVPLRAASVLGATIVATSCAFGVYSLYAKLVMHESPKGFTALVLVVILMAGVELLFLGVIGEYVGRIYTEVKRRPTYVVARVITQGASHQPVQLPL